MSDNAGAIVVKPVADRFEVFFEPPAVTASANADYSGSAMIAWRPSAEEAEALHLDGGEDVDQLHCTLLYLGKVADVNAENVAALARAIADRHSPFIARVQGTAVFNTPDGDVLVRLVDAPELEALQQQFHDEICKDETIPDNHGFTAHITIKYLAPDEDVDPAWFKQPPLDVRISSIETDLGNERTELPLATSVSLGESDGHPFRGNQWTGGTGQEDGSAEHPFKTDSAEEAAAIIAEGKYVQLPPEKVSVLMDKLAEYTRQAKALGEKAPTYDLCKISVPDSNLFCAESKGIPRVEMPQLSGFPLDGTRAAELPKNQFGETDITDAFRAQLKSDGFKFTDEDVPAAFLKPTQNELNGAKVAGIMQTLEAGKLPPGRIFVSNDNYVVDGHHRWAANVGEDYDDAHPGDVKLAVTKVDMPISELLDYSKSFANYMGIPQQGVAAGPVVVSAVAPLELGEAEGHPFRGNQYSGGTGAEQLRADASKLDLATWQERVAARNSHAPWYERMVKFAKDSPPPSPGTVFLRGTTQPLEEGQLIDLPLSNFTTEAGSDVAAEYAASGMTMRLAGGSLLDESAYGFDARAVGDEAPFDNWMIGGQFRVSMISSDENGQTAWLSSPHLTSATPLEFGDSEGHPFHGNQWTGGQGGADAFVEAHPRLPGEAVFDWQARIVKGLPEQQQSDLIFATRERYEPVGYLADGIARWNEDHGLPPLPANVAETPVNLKEADDVANFFEDAPDQSGDPRVAAAYEDFQRQNNEMFDYMTKPEADGGLGVKVDFTTQVNPYATAAEQAADLRDNHHVTIESGLGGQHDQTMSREEYDNFRAVHDVFGHAGIGGGFDRHGEYEAWLTHASMYTGAGRDAMSTEYHGVNSAAWTGDPGTPGTGKSLLLPEKWANPPWDRGSVTAAAGAKTQGIVDALGLDSAWATRFSAMPWHTDDGKVVASIQLELGDSEGHAFHGNQWTGGRGDQLGTIHPDDVAAFLKDSAYKDTLYHGTAARSVSEITREGFLRPSAPEHGGKGWGGVTLGDGVYVTPDPKLAGMYAQMVRGELQPDLKEPGQWASPRIPQDTRVLPVVADVQKPFKIDATDTTAPTGEMTNTQFGRKVMADNGLKWGEELGVVKERWAADNYPGNAAKYGNDLDDVINSAISRHGFDAVDLNQQPGGFTYDSYYGHQIAVLDPSKLRVVDPNAASQTFHATQTLDFGEQDGHPFRGNQWTKGEGGGLDGTAGSTIRGETGQRMLRSAMAEGLPDGRPFETDYGSGTLAEANDSMRGAAKSEVVDAASKDIADAALTNPAVKAEMDEKMYTKSGMTADAQSAISMWAIDNAEFDDAIHALPWDDRPAFGESAYVKLAQSMDSYPGDAEIYGRMKAQQYVDEWASSSAQGAMSLALQEATRQELGAESSSFDEYVHSSNLVSGDFVRVPRVIEREGDTMATFVRGEYARTQSFLKDNGISEVTVYRGVHFGKDDVPSPFHENGTYPVDMNPASSWSVDRETADSFALGSASENNHVLTMTVPAEDIISTARTGVGALHEGEVVVRNQSGAQAYVERHGADANGLDENGLPVGF